MLLDTHETYRAEWHGAFGEFGGLYIILQEGKVLHRGGMNYIRSKWRKLTGKELRN